LGAHPHARGQLESFRSGWGHRIGDAYGRGTRPRDETDETNGAKIGPADETDGTINGPTDQADGAKNGRADETGAADGIGRAEDKENAAGRGRGGRAAGAGAVTGVACGYTAGVSGDSEGEESVSEDEAELDRHPFLMGLKVR
jgi:hypothetical protein